jgi:hypothetical protein
MKSNPPQYGVSLPLDQVGYTPFLSKRFLPLLNLTVSIVQSFSSWSYNPLLKEKCLPLLKIMRKYSSSS